MNLCNPNEIKQLLARHGFRFSKSMGQNFLIEDWVPTEIANQSGATTNHAMLEIGAGIGVLTQELAQRAGKVVSVELDRTLLPILAETLVEHENIEVITGDILKQNLDELVDEHFEGLTPLVCANLPYNITSPVLGLLIESGRFEKITVMIQKEVAERICAKAGDSDYGAFSVYCQYHCHTELLFEVPPTCFMPAPKVTSAVISLTPRHKPSEVDDPKHFFKVVKGGFAQRRKTLQNSLSSTMSQYSKEVVAEAIIACGLPADVRGQRLTIENFAMLSKILREKESSHETN
ncbi:MAG: 16S rRNA (adenine(1518)-N(6)/adenine(1519)-N(6))-dimethyltransferase RsmA [Eubacteriales bacterium]